MFFFKNMSWGTPFFIAFLFPTFPGGGLYINLPQRLREWPFELRLIADLSNYKITGFNKLFHFFFWKLSYWRKSIEEKILSEKIFKVQKKDLMKVKIRKRTYSIAFAILLIHKRIKIFSFFFFYERSFCLSVKGIRYARPKNARPKLANPFKFLKLFSSQYSFSS